MKKRMVVANTNSYLEPGTVISTSYILTHLILTAFLCNSYYALFIIMHLMNEKSKARIG